MNVKLGTTVTLRFTTSNAATGAAQNADSLPSVAIYEDGNDTPISTPAAVAVNTGQYRVDGVATTANGFEAGKSYSVVATATVAGVTGKGVVATFIVQLNDLDSAAPSASAIRAEIDANSSDLNALLADTGTLLARLTAARASAIDNLDTAVSTRLAAGAYVAPDNAKLALIEKILRNKTITDPVAGTMTVCDDNGAVLLVAPLFEDVAGNIPYRGRGADRRERLA